MATRSRWFAAGVALSLALAGCTASEGTDDSDDAAQAAQTPAEATEPDTTDLDGVTVDGAFGEEVSVDYSGGYASTEPAWRVISEGEGDPAPPGAVLRTHYSVVDGPSGEMIASTYGGAETYLVLDPAITVDTFMAGLGEARPGKRVLFAQPGPPPEGPESGEEEPGEEEPGEEEPGEEEPGEEEPGEEEPGEEEPGEQNAEGDSEDASGGESGAEESGEPTPATDAELAEVRLIVVDVLAVLPSRSMGEPQDVSPGLPRVELAENGTPAVSMPDAPAPTEMLIATLKKGDGPEVTPGQTITAMYSGYKYTGGEPFDTTWVDMTPRDFDIGSGRVIKAWDAGLTGQTIGSQVLIVAPPGDAYGPQGSPEAGIGGDDTLVFVVDILDAR